MSATITTTYAGTVTALARRFNALAVDGEVPPSGQFAIWSELYAAADHAGISRDDVLDDLKDEIEAGPVTATR